MILIDAGSTFIKSWNSNYEFYQKNYSTLNNGVKYGSDIVTRMEKACSSEENYSIIRNLFIEDIIKHLNFHKIDYKFDLKKENPVEVSDEKVFIIGNTVMHHFYYNLDFSTLSKKPFKAHDRKDDFSQSVIFLRGTSSFAGSDIFPLYYFLEKIPEKNVIACDLGTNCEIILKNNTDFYITSAPAGSAFEKKIDIDKNFIKDVFTERNLIIFGDKSEGKYESILPDAFIKLISFFLKNGVINKNGFLQQNYENNGFVVDNNKLRDFLNARAAVVTALETLKKTYSKNTIVDKIIITGNMIKKESLEYMKILGIIPDIKAEFVPDLQADFLDLLLKKNEFESFLKNRFLYIPHFNLKNYQQNFINNLKFGEIKW